MAWLTDIAPLWVWLVLVALVLIGWLISSETVP